MKNTIGLGFAAIVLGAAIASCGNHGALATSTATPTPVATPSTPCTPPPNTSIQVVYPQPNSTGISTGTIVIAVAPSPLPTNYNLYVVGSDTATNVSFGGAAYGSYLSVIPFSQVPQPSLNPPFALPYYESSYFGGLFAASATFAVYLANSNCYPGVYLNATFGT
jgi:hypothetical protein